MAIRPIRLIRAIRKILPRLKALEERTTDTDTQLKQFISLLSIKDGLPPIPPKHLQFRVAGSYYPEFFNHGERMFHDIEDLLKSHGESFFRFKNILDFGCGCGRFMIPMSYRIAPKKISGTDIDEEAIRWLKENYTSFNDLDANGFMPPTKYADGTFDFVFGISIFTHLPEDMQHAWLKELSRIIQPGGYGLFTTHGENHFDELKKPAYGETAHGELMKRGFYYSVRDSTDGLPDFYQTSFHTHDYIKRVWAEYFEVVCIRKQGIGQNQDAVLVRKGVAH